MLCTTSPYCDLRVCQFPSTLLQTDSTVLVCPLIQHLQVRYNLVVVLSLQLLRLLSQIKRVERIRYEYVNARRAGQQARTRAGRAGRCTPAPGTCSINRLPYFSIRELSKRSDTLIPPARTRRTPKLVFYIQSIQSLMLFVRDITGMLPMFTVAPNHIGFANFCLRTLFHFTVSSGRENAFWVFVLSASFMSHCVYRMYYRQVL